jgi:acetyl-CoA carboxylase biotin carboxylase subunit
MESGATVVPHYDSMIAKLITHGRDRQEAIARMRRALDEFVIDGIKTTIPLHRRIFDDSDFQKGHVSTAFLEQLLAR